jgi:dynein heavy chain
LLKIVRGSLEKLEKGIKGEILISEDLELIMENMLQNRVPALWKQAYHTLKSLSSWIDDLNKRVNFMKDWAFKGQPIVFWISGFTYPTGFTTAVQQISARKIGEAIDRFVWTYAFHNNDSAPKAPPDGAYVSGLFLEGAKWDSSSNKLVEPETMKLFYPMPIIHFKPTIGGDQKKSKKTDIKYRCPTYMFPIRTATRERPSFMFYVDLPCHDN